MEEEFYGMHPDDEIFYEKENKKRKMKTPFQLDALESFYNAHKYPSESLKLQFAKDVGLSLKQVSGWFCHRRLKDKRSVKNEPFEGWNQNTSNGIAHEPSSILVQESCSSTKHGDSRVFDPREVESKRLHGLDSLAENSKSAKIGKNLHPGSSTTMDDTSPGSSSASREVLLQVSEEQSGDANCTAMNVNNWKDRKELMKYGYLGYSDDKENPYICSVKRKLGRLYQEDGPPLGIYFDSLPPGAFNSPIRDSSNECYYMEGPLLKSPTSGFAGARKYSKAYEKHGSDIYPPRLYSDGRILRKSKQSTQHQCELSDYPSRSALLLTNSNPYNIQTSALGKDEEYCRQDSDFDNKKHGTCSKAIERQYTKPVPCPQLKYDSKGHMYDSKTHIPRTHESFGTYSDSKPRRLDVLNKDYNLQPRRLIKCGKPRERRAQEDTKSMQLKVHEKEERKIDQRMSHHRFPQKLTTDSSP